MKKTILIADDDADSIALVKELVGANGYVFVEVHNGKQVVDTAKQHKADLVILDVVMPGKQGLYVFNDLRKDPATKSIPVIIVTALESQTGIRYSGEKMRRLFGDQPEAFLSKPIEPKELQDAVKAALGGDT
jgi:CheY-like chemotaxis protein